MSDVPRIRIRGFPGVPRLRQLVVVSTVGLTLVAQSALGSDPIFDVAALTSTPLNPRTLKRAESESIVTEDVMFHSERDGEKDVEIFAYFSYPKDAAASGKKLPAYVWNQGGLGQASPGATIPGAKRGYAVLCIDFPQRGYRSTGDYLINSGLELPADPRQAPIYHGAVALLKAVSYLASRPEVNPDRIGMAGSSWGGFFTTLMIGIDPRLKAGAAFYGTGNLQIGNAWWDGRSQNGRQPPILSERERWRTTLDPAWRLPTKKTPIAWFTGTNDEFYLLPSVMRSHEMAAGEKQLMLVPNWHHALPPADHDEQLYAWLDAHLQGKPLTLKVSPIAVTNDSGRLFARWQFQGVANRADLIASYGEAGNWRARYWFTLHSEIEEQTCRAELPVSTLPCYVSGSVVNSNSIRVSTPLLRVDATALGIKATRPVTDYDGCAEWGGFEADSIAYLARHDRSGQTRWIPQVSSDAKAGTQSAILPSGTTRLAPILGTVTVPHRIECWLKADRPIEVTLDLCGARKTHRVESEWTQVTMELTPPNELMGGIAASISIPDGVTVLLDAVSFRPILAASGP